MSGVADTPICDLDTTEVDPNQEYNQAGNVGGEQPLQQPGGEEGHDDRRKSTDHDRHHCKMMLFHHYSPSFNFPLTLDII